MVGYENKKKLCLILIFLILGSITMMLFLKNKGIGVKRENPRVVKAVLPPSIDKEVKDVIAKGNKVIPEIKRKISDALPAMESMMLEKAKTDELKVNKKNDNKTLTKENQDEAMMDTGGQTKNMVKENIFTSDLDEILDSEVFKDDRENGSSPSNGERVALKMSAKVIQKELRNLYKKRIEALTYLE